MATYNGARFLREQLDSILNQTIQDFEVVVCDDCSVDSTYSILEEYSDRDSRFRIFSNDSNLGFINNFEKIISLCSGEYIALCDQDDIWLPDHLEVLINAMDDNSQLACGKPIFVNELNEKLPKKYNYFKMDYIPENNEDMARHLFLCRGMLQGASMMIKNSFFNKALPIPKGALYHDSWFTALACFSGGVKYVDKPVMRYRRYGNAVTSSLRKLSPARLFIGSVLVNHSVIDRLVFIKTIKERVDYLSPNQTELLNTFEKLLKRRTSIWGRIANIPYLLRHFKAIYCYDGKHLFTI